MLKNKKVLLTTLAAIPMIATPTALASSCNGASEGSVELWLATDGGSIDDKSFNQQGREALQEIRGLDRSGSLKYIANAADSVVSSIYTCYQTIANSNGEYVLATGYYHDDTIEAWNKDNGTDALKFLLADAPSGGRSNVSSIQYNTQESAFLAGVMSGLYLQSIGDIDPKVGIWGGGNFPAVTDFLIGYVNGIDYYNNNLLNGHPMVAFVKLGYDESYTDSGFDPGEGTTKAKTLLLGGADILFPVAAIQFEDALSEVSTSTYVNKKVIGVDVDAVKSHKDKESFILTSVLKDVKNGLIGLYKSAIGTDDVPSWAKGFGQDSIGTLKNGLTGIQSNSNYADEYSAATATDIIEASMAASKDSSKNTWEQALALLKTI